jgi:hypothetical protein
VGFAPRPQRRRSRARARATAAIGPAPPRAQAAARQRRVGAARGPGEGARVVVWGGRRGGGGPARSRAAFCAAGSPRARSPAVFPRFSETLASVRARLKAAPAHAPRPRLLQPFSLFSLFFRLFKSDSDWDCVGSISAIHNVPGLLRHEQFHDASSPAPASPWSVLLLLRRTALALTALHEHRRSSSRRRRQSRCGPPRARWRGEGACRGVAEAAFRIGIARPARSRRAALRGEGETDNGAALCARSRCWPGCGPRRRCAHTPPPPLVACLLMLTATHAHRQ